MMIAVLLTPSVGVSQTTLECPLLENATLLLSDSPYLLECDLELEDVIIEPGVRIEASGDFEIRVLGGLRAVGTQSQRIVFTTTDDSAKWQGIYFSGSTAESELTYCVVENSINSGIRINEASPIIRYCEIVRNQAIHGAGINISGSLPVTLESCKIHENTYAGRHPRGGGIYTTSHLTLIRCEVLNNAISDRHGSCWDGSATTYGGGIFSTTDVVLETVVVTGNTASSMGGSENSRGGGVYASGGLFANNCTIANNSAGAGGCNIGNGARGYGGGIYCNSTLELKNCIIANNATRFSNGYGGGIYAINGSIENCTIVCNNSPGGVYFGGKIVNSILWGNSSYQFGGGASATFSCVEGIAAGNGNIPDDPMLPACDPAAPESLRIPCVSPCADAGNPDPQYDDDSFPPLCVSCGTTRNDMGAHGGPGGCGFDIIGFHVEITSPPSSSEFLVGEPISFAVAIQGGEPPFSCTWSSDLDGEFGTGESLEIVTLSPGVHAITVVCVDGAERTDDDSILLTVRETSPTDVIWIGSGSDDYWSTISNWLDGLRPRAIDTAIFNAGDSGGTNVVGSSLTVAGLRYIGNGIHTTDLNGGSMLQVDGRLIVGLGGSANGSTTTWTNGGSVTVGSELGGFQVDIGTQTSGSITGSLTIEDTVFDAFVTEFYIGRKSSSIGGGTATGTLIVEPGGVMTIHGPMGQGSIMHIGYNQDANASSGGLGEAIGVFDVTAPGAALTLDLTELNVGRSVAGAATGTLRWDQQNPIHAGNVYFGRGQNATGILDVPSGGSFLLGTAREPVESLRLGYNDSNIHWSGTTQGHLDFTVTDPVFEGHIAGELSIGHRATSAGGGTSTGSLVLGSNSTLVVGTTINPAVLHIGYNQDADASSGGLGEAIGVFDVTAPGAALTLDLTELNVGRSLFGAASGMMTQGSGAIVRANIVRIGTGGSATGTYDLQGGTLTAGTVTLGEGGTFSFSSGTLEIGTFNGSLIQDGGTLTSLSSPGIVTINGSYELGEGGTVAIELVETGGSIEHDILDVSGTAALNGTLNITLVNSPVPLAGQTFDVLEYSDHIGGFSHINGLDIGNGLVLHPEYLETGLRLTVRSALFVVSHGPIGSINRPVSSVDVTFSNELNDTTFGLDDLAMTGPNGPVPMVDPPQPLGGTIWRISFPEQSTEGEYCVYIGPHVEDLGGTEMDQDFDGTPGEEPDDVYAACFTIQGLAGFHVDITSPVDGAAFGSGETIPFIAVPTGGDPPFSYEWFSDIDGSLGSGQSLEISTVTINDHVITVFAADNSARDDDDAVTVSVIATPDLQVTGIDAPCAGVQGQAFEVTWTVTNNGMDVASAPWTDQLLLSDDPAVGVDTPLLPVFSYTEDLATGESYTRTEGVTLPEGTLGEHWIVVATDVNDDVDEGVDEANNNAADPESFRIHAPDIVSLCAWTEMDYEGDGTAGDWQLSEDGLSVDQIINGQPTYFVSDFDLDASQFLQGSFRVRSEEWDNDYIGFVFGFLGLGGISVDERYYLLSWKKGDQESAHGLGWGEQGFKLMKIVGPNPNLWDAEPTPGQIEMLARYTRSDGAPGWQDGVEYNFFLTYQVNGNIRVIIRRESDQHEMWNTGLLTDPDPLGAGKVGFYNYSQENVFYAGFTQGPLEWPEADAGGPYDLDASMADVPLDATDSWDPDGELGGFDDIVSLQWDLGCDGVQDDAGRTDPHEIIWFEDVLAKGLALGADVPMCLTVLDVDGLDGSDEGTIQYLNSSPTADAAGPYGPVYPGASAMLDGRCDDPDLAVGVGEFLVIEWDVTPATQASDVGDGFADQCAVDVPYETLLPLYRDYGDTLYLNVADTSGIVASSATTIELALPNLTIDEVLDPMPTEGWIGQPITVGWSVTNTGNARAEGSWQDCVFLSDDEEVGDDQLLGCLPNPVDLDVGGDYRHVGDFIVPAIPEGGYWIIVTTDNGNVLAEMDESDNATASGPIPNGSIPCADLEPSDLVIPEEAAAGGPAGIVWRVTNVGNMPTDAALWYDRVYLSRNQELDGTAPIGAFPNPMALNTEEDYSHSVQVTIPQDSWGYYYVIVKTDADADLSECYEDNNVIRSSTRMYIPEKGAFVLQVNSVTNCGQTYSPGVALPLTAGDWRVTVLDNTNNYYDAYTFWSDRHLWRWAVSITVPGSVAMEQWAPSLGYWTTQQAALAANVGGSTVIHVGTDSTAHFWIRDTPCTDNYGGVTVRVEPYSDARPNLVISNPEVPLHVCTGEAIDVSWTVTNNGDTPATGMWQDCAFLSDDDQFGGDTPLGCYDRLFELDAAEWYEQIVTVAIPGVDGGKYWLIIQADNGKVVPETDEADNDATVGPIWISAPNLTIGEMLDPMPTEGWTCQPITVGWTVANTGDCMADGSWQDCVYLSDDGIIGDDELLDCMGNPVDLDVGESYNRVRNFNVPVVPEGDYWIVVKANDGCAFAKTDCTDNDTIDGPFLMRECACADLVPSGLEIPVEAVAGGPAGVDWIVTNVGEGPTGAVLWRDRVYLSLNQELDVRTDQMVGGFWNPMALNTEGAYAQRVRVTVPEDQPPGDYYVFVKTDADADLSECYEDNNVIRSSTRMYIIPIPEPSLAITSLQIEPPNPWPGDPVTLTWAISNTSDVPIGPCEITHDLWLSDDGSLGGDRSLATRVSPTIVDLSPDETSDPISADVELPLDVWGEKYVIVSPQAIDCTVDTWPSSAQISIVTPPMADLVIDLFEPPTTGISGESATITWRVRNDIGQRTLSDVWQDVVILSEDDSLATTENNWSLGSLRHNGVLDGNGFYDAQLNVTLPEDANGTYYVFLHTDASNQVYEGGAEWEDNNWSGPEPINIEYRAPDLQVQSVIVTADNPTLSGTPITIEWAVTNAGDWTTRASGWQDRIYISADDVLDGNDPTLDTVWQPGSLAAGEGYEDTRNVTIPLAFIAPTTYVFVCTDVSNREYESDEDNNCTSSEESFEVTWGPADLVVLGVDVTVDGEPVSSVLSGSTITVEWQVHNDGPGATSTASWYDRIYISDDDVLDTSSDPVLDTDPHNGVLAAEGGYTATQDVTIPIYFTAPTAYVFVTTDYNNQVVESDDDNNSNRIDNPFEVTWGAADLVVLTVDVTVDGAPVSSVPSGSTVTVEWQVHNDGPGATSAASWSDRIYISADDVLDTSSDLPLDAKRHNGVLAAEDGYTAARDVTIPIYFTAPTAYVFVTTDHDNEVVEFDDDNNSNRTDDPIEVVWGEPDLIVQSVSAVHGTPHGEVIDLSWTVRNLGGPTVVAEWHDAVYLSDDRGFSLDDQERETPTGPLATHIGALDYDQTYSRTELIAVPPDSSGYLIVMTDASDPDQVTESDGANNDAYSALPSFDCYSDLIVTEVGAPATALSGQLMAVHWTLTNQGDHATNTGAWRDAVYLSPDQYLDRDSDVYLGYLNHSGVLDAGVGYDPPATFNVRVPAGTSGPYYVLVIADSSDNVCETDEGNNVGRYDAAVQVELPPLADLVVTNILVPPSGTLGEEVTIQWTIRNDGAFDAQGGWHDSVYISADAEWDIGDRRIGSVQHVGPLAPGAEYNPPASLTAPLPGVVTGDYYIIVRADVHNEVPEAIDGEQNNITPSTEQLTVDCWELAEGAADDTHQLSTGSEHYFKIPGISEGDYLLIRLDCDDDSASTELYARHGAVPDRGHYDFAYSALFVADHEIVVPATQAGDYYLLVRGDSVPGGPSGYTVANRLLEFEIHSISPSQAGNAGSVTALIKGSQLSPDTVARMVAGESVIEGTTWPNPTPTQMFVTFDLRDAAPDVYDVEIETPDEASVALSAEAPDPLPGAFEVVEGTGPSLEVHLIAPSRLRVNQPYTVHIAYANTGDADLPAPLFSLSAPDGVPLRLEPAEAPWPGPVQVLGISMEGPPGILRPGVWQQIPVYSRTPNTAGALELSLGMMVADATPIDWGEMEDSLRPDDIPAELWAAPWADLTTGIGTTWADFLATMTDSATYLASVGERTYDLRELFGVVIKNASGGLGLRLPLAIRVDGYSPAPGLPLAFVPVALNNLAQRFHVGPLGRGWSHNFEYSLTHVDEDNVLVSVPGGFTRPFTKQPDDSWKGSPGDFGMLEELGGDTYQITEKGGVVSFFGPSGHLAFAEEPNGNRITLNYSGDDLVDVSHSNGHQFALAYNAEGRIVSLTDHVGRVTEYQYDGTGEHLTQAVSPGNRVTLYEYNSTDGNAADHALSAITFPDGTHRYYAYDAQGRLAEVSRDAGTARYTLTYSEFGTVQVFDADGNVSTLRLGSNGQLVEVQDALGHTLSLDYDDDFNLVHLTAPDSAEYELGYDGLGNLTESVDPLDAIITLGYTPDLNRLDWLSDARDYVMDFNSDGQGNLIEIVHPDTSNELFGYDERGLIVTVTNRRGQTITYAHDDPEGRLKRKDYPDGRSIDYDYDDWGNLLSVVDSLTGAITMEYDGRDFLTSIEYPGGIWFTFEYNDAGWRIRRTGHDGYVLNYDYDAAGRLRALTDGDGGQIIQYGYDAVGRLAREDKGNGTYTTYEYDAAGQILHLVNYAPDGAVQSGFDYTYDPNGNPTSMVIAEDGQPDEAWIYGYDAAGQLTSVVYPSGRVVTYEYDFAGNRVTVIDDDVPTQYTTNNLNQYTQVGDVSYSYDADGNMTSKTENTGITEYEYDVENRLIRVVTPTDGTWNYTYDGFGNRIVVTRDGVATRYVHDPIGLTDVATEYEEGALSARYINGIGLVARIDDASSNAYYAYDAIGHTRQLSNGTGVVANAYDYDPFGVRLATSESIPNPFRYVGCFGVMREENGLDFMRARYYSPLLGRFLTPDPIHLLGGDLNLYRYAGNSPSRWSDPTGLVLYTREEIVRVLKRAYPKGSAGRAVLDNPRRNPAEVAWYLQQAIREYQYARYSSNEVLTRAEEARDLDILRWLNGYATKATTTLLEGARILAEPAGIFEMGVSAFRSGYANVKRWLIQIVGSVDPNEKLAPDGHGEMRSVPIDHFLPYRINFENLPDASAPAQQVTVADELSGNLDWRTFQLVEIALGDTVTEVPDRRPHFYGEIALGSGLIARINAGIDIETGLASWTLTAIDPETGEQPEDPLVGLLPPNDPEIHNGEGYVTFTIRPESDLTTGTEITNAATIIFDTNEPIETNEVFNTIDAVAPSSSVTGPSGAQPNPYFDVTWEGQDDDGGSGVASYSIYYRLVGEPYTLWLTTPDTSATFTAPLGSGQYDFYSLATDGAGNTESPPPAPDTTVLIYPAVPPAPLLGIATAVTVRIIDLGNFNVGSVEHAVYEETTQQWVGENRLLTGEPFWQPLDQWRGFQVRALSPVTEYSFTAKARYPETEFGPLAVATTSIQGDANGDGLVTQADVTIVQQALGWQFGDPGFDARADLNADDEVTFADLGVVNLMRSHNGDYTDDDLVALDDFRMFACCMNGPDQAPNDGGCDKGSECSHGDMDLDTDLDLADFAAIQHAFGLN